MGLISLLSCLCLDESPKRRKRTSPRHYSSPYNASYTPLEKSPCSQFSSPQYSSSSNKSTPERHGRNSHHYVKPRKRSSSSGSARRHASSGRNVSNRRSTRPDSNVRHRSNHTSSKHKNDRPNESSTRQNRYRQAVDSSIDLLAGHVAGLDLSNHHLHGDGSKGKSRSGASKHRSMFEPGTPEAFMPAETADEEPVYYCEYCLERFTTPGLRKRHVDRKHARRFQCELCGEWFGLKKDLERHFISRHSPEPGKYRCQHPWCKTPHRRYKRKDHLQRHERTCGAKW